LNSSSWPLHPRHSCWAKKKVNGVLRRPAHPSGRWRTPPAARRGRSPIEGSHFKSQCRSGVEGAGLRSGEDIPAEHSRRHDLGGDPLGVALKIDHRSMMTNLDGVFAAGRHRGRGGCRWLSGSIRDGRDAAEADSWLASPRARQPLLRTAGPADVEGAMTAMRSRLALALLLLGLLYPFALVSGAQAADTASIPRCWPRRAPLAHGLGSRRTADKRC